MRNCSLGAISPFPTVFSKELYCRHIKTQACLGKGENLTCIASDYLRNKLHSIVVYRLFNPLPDDKF